MIIELTQGRCTKVDDDFPKSILNNKFCVKSCGGKYYASTNIKGKTVYLHRLITNAPKGMVVDHINGDTLDNQIKNLRVCLSKENTRNQKNHPDKWQKYRGVDYMKAKSKYRARITFNREEIHLGLFDTDLQAFRAYVNASKILFGKFSNV